MEEHSCPRCGYETKILCNFELHLKRKTLCKPIIADISLEETKLKYIKVKISTHTCDNCDKAFYSRSRYYEHKKHCMKDNVINDLKEEIDIMKKKIETLSINNTTNNTTNNNNTINNTINIQINGLGKEDLNKMINHTKYKDFMLNCINKEMYGLSNYLMQKHFSPNAPENHNIKKRNKKDKFISVYNGSKWETKLINDALEEVFNNIEKDFQSFFISRQDDREVLKKNIMDKFMRSVGAPLNWSLDHDNYEFDEDIKHNKKELIKRDIYMLICEQIYQKSKELNI